VVQLGRNANGEVLVPGRVPDCYLGLHLDSGGTEAAGVLVVAPAALLHPHVLRPDGSMLYDLVTGHPDRAPHELVFLADLSVELGAWASGTWTRLGVDQRAAAGAVIAAWRGGHVRGLKLGGLTAEEALSLERSAMTYVREQLRERLARQVGQAYRRWLHPTADAGRATASCSSGHPQAAAVSMMTAPVRTSGRPQFGGASGHQTLPQPPVGRIWTWP
jgi:hypothetical protein